MIQYREEIVTMKHIYLNLKRFDIPTETGGVNRIASPAEWGPYIVSHTQDQLAAYNPKDVEFAMFSRKLI